MRRGGPAERRGPGRRDRAGPPASVSGHGESWRTLEGHLEQIRTWLDDEGWRRPFQAPAGREPWTSNWKLRLEVARRPVDRALN
jgi:hypothetical protein